MGFLDRIRQVMGGRADRVDDWGRVSEAWGLVDPDDDAVSAGPMTDDPHQAAPYDLEQWQRKFRRVLEGLPLTRDEWDTVQREARALEFKPGWVEQFQRGEFGLLVRRAVADRVVDFDEHSKLDLARDLIGLSDAEAEEILRDIVAEAEAIFCKPVEGA